VKEVKSVSFAQPRGSELGWGEGPILSDRASNKLPVDFDGKIGLRRAIQDEKVTDKGW
jgi:hypothetical protein